MDRFSNVKQQPDTSNAPRFQNLMDNVYQLDAIQNNYQPKLELLAMTEDEKEVTIGVRAGSANVLRCLKIWYDFKSDVLINAVNIMDRFLTKMKVQRKHMACISVASFHLACQMEYSVADVPNASRLISISQCNCTLSDLQRMKSIIASKLSMNISDRFVTPLTFLQVFHDIFLIADIHSTYTTMADMEELYRCAEIIACEGSYTNYKASEIALALICSQINKGIARLKPSPWANSCILSIGSMARKLRKMCMISESTLSGCMNKVMDVVADYNTRSITSHRQILTWPVSKGTLQKLRPTKKLVTVLPTIEEQR